MRSEKWTQHRERTDGSSCRDSRGCWGDSIVSVGVKYGADEEPTRPERKEEEGGGNFGREEQAEEHYNHSCIDLNLWLESNLIFIIANKKKEENTKRASRRLIRISEMLRVLASTPG